MRTDPKSQDRVPLLLASIVRFPWMLRDTIAGSSRVAILTTQSVDRYVSDAAFSINAHVDTQRKSDHRPIHWNLIGVW
jgi:hypothetical protein